MKSKPPDLNASRKEITVATNMQPRSSEWCLPKKVNVSNRINIERILNMSRGQTVQRTQILNDRWTGHTRAGW